MADDAQQIKVLNGTSARGLASAGGDVEFPTASHQALVNEVGAQIEVIAKLVSDAGQIKRQIDELGAERPGVEEPQLDEPWAKAIEELAKFLRAPVQVRDGESPEPITEALDTMKSWIEAYEDNARGADGRGLLSDEGRLKTFAERIGALSPEASELAHEAESLLSRQDLTVAALKKITTERHEAIVSNAQREEAIKAKLSELRTTWGQTLSEIEAKTAELKRSLEAVLADENASALMKTKASAGIKAIDSLGFKAYAENLRTVADWVEKYRHDPALTLEKLNARINESLAPEKQKIEAEFSRIIDEYQPTKLAQHEEVRRTKVHQSKQSELEEMLAELRTIYQNLVGVRKKKLGAEPDPRYFGAIAKEVNDLISSIGALENDLLDAQRQLLKDKLFFELDPKLSERLATIKSQSASFTDPQKLEETLAASQLKLIAPLKAAIQKAEASYQQARAFVAKNRHRAGLTPELRKELAEKLRSLEKKIAEAKAASKQADLSQATIERLAARLSELVNDTDNSFVLETPSERSELKSKTNSEKPSQDLVQNDLKEVEQLATKIHRQLTSSLGKLKALEALTPELAASWYEKINTCLGLKLPQTSLTVEQTLKPEFFAELKEDLKHDPEGVSRTTKLVQAALGPTGFLAGLLTEVSDFLATDPVTNFKERKKSLQSLYGQIGQKDALVKRLRAKLVGLESQPITVTPAELTTITGKITRTTDALNVVSAELGRINLRAQNLANQLENPRFEQEFALLRTEVDQLELPELPTFPTSSNKEMPTLTLNDKAKTGLGDQLRRRLS